LLCCGESHSRLTGFPLAVSECLSLESREAWRIEHQNGGKEGINRSSRSGRGVGEQQN